MKRLISYYFLRRLGLLFILVAFSMLFSQAVFGKQFISSCKVVNAEILFSSDAIIQANGGDHSNQSEAGNPWESYPAEEDQKEETGEKDYDETDTNSKSDYRLTADFNYAQTQFKSVKQILALQARISLFILHHAWRSHLS